MSIYAVNGKEPVAAWIPSLDTAGNGTTTLTDLIGSNDGTLTNMDAATDWVADTDAGGVRALDFDGVNDFVSLQDPNLGQSNFSITGWFRTISATRQAFVSSYRVGDVGIIIDILNTGRLRFAIVESTGINSAIINTTIEYNDGNWHFFVAVRTGAASISLTVDNTTLTATGIGNANVNTPNMRLGAVPSGYNAFLNGRLDDIRVWDVALDATDVAALYANGLGRGVGRRVSIYAVNGKEPVAAWIPSLDTAGNGTTTLTDLVGSNNGTLTNMDAATDWVADADAGGVRALDFDGVNDFVSLPSGGWGQMVGNVSLTVSMWAKPRTVSTRQAILADWSSSGSAESFAAQIYNPGKVGVFVRLPAIQVTDITGISVNSWTHLVFSVSNGLNVYIDGAIAYSNPTTIALAYGVAKTIGRAGDFSALYYNGLLDDIRIWNQPLDATDVAALYAGGLGRGITFGGVDKWSLLRRGNRMEKIGVMSSPNQHIARGIRMAQMGITI